eukprot:354861-Chlamydomonas_euryale.AAC.19
MAAAAGAAPNNKPQDSLHGESAAKRQAITELLFFASVGDLHRCRKIVQAWNLKVPTRMPRGRFGAGASGSTGGGVRRAGRAVRVLPPLPPPLRRHATGMRIARGRPTDR